MANSVLAYSLARALHHRFGELLEDSVVTSFIGISKVDFGALLDPDVVKLCGVRIHCTVDVAQTAFLRMWAKIMQPSGPRH